MGSDGVLDVVGDCDYHFYEVHCVLKIPHKVRIKAKVSYDILWIEDRPDLDCWGWCDKDKKQIVLVKGRSEQKTVKTLIHEILHAMEFEHDIALPHKEIHKLEGVILQVVKLNGWL